MLSCDPSLCCQTHWPFSLSVPYLTSAAFSRVNHILLLKTSSMTSVFSSTALDVSSLTPLLALTLWCLRLKCHRAWFWSFLFFLLAYTSSLGNAILLHFFKYYPYATENPNFYLHSKNWLSVLQWALIATWQQSLISLLSGLFSILSCCSILAQLLTSLIYISRLGYVHFVLVNLSIALVNNQ